MVGESGKTDMQVAIDDSIRQGHAFFKIRVGVAGTVHAYQQSIPVNFARKHMNLLRECITVEGPIKGPKWKMVLLDYCNVVRFSKGWRQFSVENHLQVNYQLLFTLVDKLRFRVQFFDQQGKRCISYPPLPKFHSGFAPVARTQHHPRFRRVVHGGRAFHRRGSEAQSSAPAVPFMGSAGNSGIPLNSEQNKVFPRQHGAEVRGPEASLPHEHMRELEETSYAG